MVVMTSQHLAQDELALDYLEAAWTVLVAMTSHHLAQDKLALDSSQGAWPVRV